MLLKPPRHNSRKIKVIYPYRRDLSRIFHSSRMVAPIMASPQTSTPKNPCLTFL